MDAKSAVHRHRSRQRRLAAAVWPDGRRHSSARRPGGTGSPARPTQPLPNLASKRAAFRFGWIVLLVGGRSKPLPVEAGDFLDGVNRFGWIHSELAQGDRCNRITYELQFLQALLIGVSVRTMPFCPDVFVVGASERRDHHMSFRMRTPATY